MPKLTKLGKYEIRRKLGKGGMGIVYEGYDPFIQRAVAIKTVQISSIDPAEAEEIFRRFRREAQAAGRMSHPRIVSIYEYSEDHDIAFIAMELIEGRELKDCFDRKEKISLAESVSILLQLLDALDYSHRQGVVHRDIKPANIFLTADHQVKVADFGIAKIDASHLTQTGSVLGTPSYMSPEQFHGHDVDRRSDIYSAGVILYQLLAGRRPFTGSMITVMHKTLNQAPEPPSKYNPRVPAAFDEVVLHAMAKQPEQRFQSAAEFIAAIKLAMKGTDIERTITLLNPQAADDAPDADRRTTATPPAAGDRETWETIRDSLDPELFRQYLQEHPQGEFADLAQLRLKILDREAIQALKSEELRKLKAEQQAHQEQELAATRAREKLEAKQREKSAAGIIRKKEIAQQNLRAGRLAALQAKMTQLRAEANDARQQEAVRRKLETEEQARRAQQLSGLMAERTRKISEIVARREAEADARRKLEAERVQKLQSRVKLRRKTDTGK